jgi:hypothetical protein
MKYDINNKEISYLILFAIKEENGYCNRIHFHTIKNVLFSVYYSKSMGLGSRLIAYFNPLFSI